MIEATLALLFGLLFGSFLNVCIYRMPRDRSIVTPRSFCPCCEHTIAWYDNVPLISYIILRGRCRHCGKPIPPRYPLVELLTGGLFFLIVLAAGPTLRSLKLCAFAALLIGLVFSDLEQRILPDQFTLGGLALGIALAALVPLPDVLVPLLLPRSWAPSLVSITAAVLAAAFSAALLWGIRAIYFRLRHREGLGFGDVKMVAMIGAFLGLEGSLLALALGSVLGTVIGLLYIWLARKDPSTYELPFGTFLGAGALVAALLPLLTFPGTLCG